MKLYADYIKEREDAELEYNDKGFVSYKKDGEGIFIIDAYIKPEWRKHGLLRSFIDKIIDKTGTSILYSTTDENANGWEYSEMAIIALGFEKKTKIGSLNYYVKYIIKKEQEIK